MTSSMVNATAWWDISLCVKKFLTEPIKTGPLRPRDVAPKVYTLRLNQHEVRAPSCTPTVIIIIYNKYTTVQIVCVILFTVHQMIGPSYLFVMPYPPVAMPGVRRDSKQSVGSSNSQTNFLERRKIKTSTSLYFPSGPRRFSQLSKHQKLPQSAKSVDSDEWFQCRGLSSPDDRSGRVPSLNSAQPMNFVPISYATGSHNNKNFLSLKLDLAKISNYNDQFLDKEPELDSQLTSDQNYFWLRTRCLTSSTVACSNSSFGSSILRNLKFQREHKPKKRLRILRAVVNPILCLLPNRKHEEY